jgi:outer membrane receptor protein involved in Fe transport
VELFNIHAEMSGSITDKLAFNIGANIYKYTLTKFAYAWNKPDWDGKLGLKYNLRDKIIAGLDVSLQGKRKMIVNGQNLGLLSLPAVEQPLQVGMPAYVNVNLSAEYRYSKILSVWTKLNNISNKKYFEWVFYPSQGPLIMVGFTYSL